MSDESPRPSVGELLETFDAVCLANVEDVASTVSKCVDLGFLAEFEPNLGVREQLAVFVNREAGVRVEAHNDDRRWQCFVSAKSSIADLGDALADRYGINPVYMPSAHDETSEGWLVENYAGGLSLMAVNTCPTHETEVCASFAAAKMAGGK